MKDNIFGMSSKEIKRQCDADILMYDSNSPIQIVEKTNPCIEGGKKILQNEKTKNYFRKIYLRSDGDE